MAELTRADLRDAVHQETGLPRREAAELVDTVIEAVAERLAAGEAVMVSGFGTFNLRDKRSRLGRDPKTGEEVLIAARRVATFRTSARLRARIAAGLADTEDGA